MKTPNRCDSGCASSCVARQRSARRAARGIHRLSLFHLARPRQRRRVSAMLDFTLSPELVALRDRTLAFVHDVVIPEERHAEEHGGLPQERLDALRQKAREAGLYAPQIASKWGGLGLDMRAMSVVFEAAGRSMLGPLALNCSAPDEGNMHLLELVASEAQKEKYLRPLVEGRIRSCFAMTEPPPGAGTDPAMLRTRAERQVGGWTLNGDKWYITGADGAA